jgi:hypothetical protein
MPARENLDEEPDTALIERAEASGWAVVGIFESDSVSVAFYRDEGRKTDSLGDMATKLGLFDQKNDLAEGFDIDILPDSGLPMVRYKGPKDQAFVEFIGQLVSLGKELDSKP